MAIFAEVTENERTCAVYIHFSIMSIYDASESQSMISI